MGLFSKAKTTQNITNQYYEPIADQQPTLDRGHRREMATQLMSAGKGKIFDVTDDSKVTNFLNEKEGSYMDPFPDYLRDAGDFLIGDINDTANSLTNFIGSSEDRMNAFAPLMDQAKESQRYANDTLNSIYDGRLQNTLQGFNQQSDSIANQVKDLNTRFADTQSRLQQGVLDTGDRYATALGDSVRSQVDYANKRYDQLDQIPGLIRDRNQELRNNIAGTQSAEEAVYDETAGRMADTRNAMRNLAMERSGRFGGTEDARIDAANNIYGAQLNASNRLLDSQFDASGRLRDARLDSTDQLRDARVDAAGRLLDTQAAGADLISGAELDSAGGIRDAQTLAAQGVTGAERGAAQNLRDTQALSAVGLSDAEFAAAGDKLAARRMAADNISDAEVSAAEGLLGARGSAASDLYGSRMAREGDIYDSSTIGARNIFGAQESGADRILEAERLKALAAGANAERAANAGQRGMRSALTGQGTGTIDNMGNAMIRAQLGASRSDALADALIRDAERRSGSGVDLAQRLTNADVDRASRMGDAGVGLANDMGQAGVGFADVAGQSAINRASRIGDAGIDYSDVTGQSGINLAQRLGQADVMLADRSGQSDVNFARELGDANVGFSERAGQSGISRAGRISDASTNYASSTGQADIDRADMSGQANVDFADTTGQAAINFADSTGQAGIGRAGAVGDASVDRAQKEEGNLYGQADLDYAQKLEGINRAAAGLGAAEKREGILDTDASLEAANIAADRYKTIGDINPGMADVYEQEARLGTANTALAFGDPSLTAEGQNFGIDQTMLDADRDLFTSLMNQQLANTGMITSTAQQAAALPSMYAEAAFAPTTGLNRQTSPYTSTGTLPSTQMALSSAPYQPAAGAPKKNWVDHLASAGDYYNKGVDIFNDIKGLM